MTSLYASRWADTPPPELKPGVEKLKQDAGASMADTDKSNENEVALVRKPDEYDPAEGGEDGGNQEQQQAVAAGDRMEASHIGGAKEQHQDDIADAQKDREQVGQAHSNGSDNASAPSAPEISRVGPPRFRTRVLCNGKTCVICIPNVNYDTAGISKPTSLTEIEERLQQFEDAGHGTKGFNHLFDEQSDSFTTVKPIFPDEQTVAEERRQGPPKVYLPDLRKWEAYMNELVEKKLAALGVGSGSEEPSPALVHEMSRQSSNQYPPLPFSPPLMPGSAGSIGRPGMARAHSHTMSVASPISPSAGPFGHMARHSTFTGPLLGFAQQPPHGPPIPGVQPLSPQHPLAIQGLPSGGSPAYASALRQDMSPARGPGSPLSQQILMSATQNYSRNLMEEQRRQQLAAYPQAARIPQMPNAFVPQNNNIHQTLVLPELPEGDDEEELLESEPVAEVLSKQNNVIQADPPAYVPPHKRAQFNADIAVPTPRGHRHNISEGLERDIMESEKRRIADDRNWIEVDEEEEQPRREHTHHHVARPALAAEKDPLGANYPVQEAVRGHKKSASRLNVAAPEFTFNPTASFQSGNRAYTFSAPVQVTNGAIPKNHTRQVSSGSFNVAAPAFQPVRAHTLPTSDFSFAAQGPSLMPKFESAAPPKQQGRTIVDELPSIFGKVVIPEIVRPPRSSKAVPIVRPEERTSFGVDENETLDEAGRIAQSEDRLKRQRKAWDDGDEVPRFAEPTSFTTNTISAHPATERRQKVDEVHNATVDDIEAEAAKVIDEIAEKAAETVETLIQEARSDKPSADNAAEAHAENPSKSLLASASSFEYPAGAPTAAGTLENTEQLPRADEDIEEGEIEDGAPATDQTQVDEAGRDGPPYPTEDVLSAIQFPTISRIDQVSHPELSFDEIDAVIHQLNEDEASVTQRDERPVSPLPDLEDKPFEEVSYVCAWPRSDAPSPSSTHQQAAYQASRSLAQDLRNSDLVTNGWPHITRLNNADDEPPSDWSDMLSQPDQDKLVQRSAFFDTHVEHVIGKAIELRLKPLEESLRSIQDHVGKQLRSTDHQPAKHTSSNVESDADDEDDFSETRRHRPVSRGREKRVDQVKVAVLEALREHSPTIAQASHDVAELHSILADMKVSFARAASSSLELDDVRAVVEDALSRQSQAVVPTAMDEGSTGRKREISELEGRLNETLAGALEEANRRHAVEEREVETRRLLRLAEEELTVLRDTRDEVKFDALEEERQHLLEKLDEAKESERHLQDQMDSLEAENHAMKDTLEEYRISRIKWRQDLEQGKREREELEATVAALERQIEESQDSAGSVKKRLEKLQTDMAIAAGQLTSEKTSWKAQERELRERCATLETQQVRLVKEKEVLVEELRVARSLSADAAELRQSTEQLRNSNTSFEGMLHKLQAELSEQRDLTARYQRELHEAQADGRTEVHRTKLAMEVEIEAAKHQVNLVRAELESDLSRTRSQLENVKAELETTKTSHERMLEEGESSRQESLRKLKHANDVALDEARQKHEAAVQELSIRHGRALQYAMEDKERAGHFYNERLALADAKMQHYQDRIALLEERLEVAKCAAQAAAMSAQSRSAATISTAADLPEKISPQALRESILVLQEQLQEREARIDELQSQAHKEGPEKLKERDTEIAWLRELLSVRSEELTELVRTLSQPSFDRDTVRDTAIRIGANLQMQQQEKQRFGYAPQSLGGQALANLSNFATPRAAQLSSAFNKWRSSMESSALKTNQRGTTSHSRSYTPSRSKTSAVPLGYTEGLMTPPASNLRNTPSPEATASLPLPRLHSRDGSKSVTSASVSSRPMQDRSRTASIASDAPTTPLFREQNYDQDAEDRQLHVRDFDDDDLDDVVDSAPPAFRSLEAEMDSSGGAKDEA